MNVNLGAKTDVGLVRQGNEDSYLIEEPLYVVADGMGGHVAGDVASTTAVSVISEDARAADPSDPDTLAALIQRANAAIWEKSQEDPALHGMGTTCTMVVIGDHLARFAHVGDSRAYMLRDGELSQLTDDHTLVYRMVREGRISPEEADHHPQRNIITRALGVDHHVEVDTIAVELRDGDRFLLCSDGLTSMVDAQTIHDVMAEESDPQVVADELVQLALEGGGEDNITVLVLDVHSEGENAAPHDEANTAVRPGVIATGADEPRARRSNEDAMAVAPAPETVMSSGPATTTGTDFRSGVMRRDVMVPKKRWPRRLAVIVVILAVLAGGAYVVVRNLLSNSYFVGVNDSGMVTIYRGIPDEIAGFDLRDEAQTTGLVLDELPSFMHDDVEQGIRADSLSEAEATVANLEDRAEGFNVEEPEPRETPNKKKNNR